MKVKLFLALALASILSACGGGGSDDALTTTCQTYGTDKVTCTTTGLNGSRGNTETPRGMPLKPDGTCNALKGNCPPDVSSTAPTTTVPPKSEPAPAPGTTIPSRGSEGASQTGSPGAAPDRGSPLPVPAPQPNAKPAFAASVINAPPDGAVIRGIVFFDIGGTGLVNAELLPPTGYEPKYAKLVHGQTNLGGYMYGQIDTQQFANGPLSVRIAAFNGEAGDPNATEITAMSVRTWIIQNPPCILDPNVNGGRPSPGQAASCESRGFIPPPN